MNVDPVSPLSRPWDAGRPLRSILRSAILAGGAASLWLAPTASLADQLTTYTFGPDGSNPGVLTPTTVAPNVTATNITADPGLVLDLTSPATQPSTTPYLRTTFTTVSTTEAAAFNNNADFKFTVNAAAGYFLNLTSLVFDAMRGGASTPRGYAVRSSVDNYATVLSTGDLPTVRPTFTNINVNLSGASFQNLSTITFKVYSYSPATGSSVDYDSFVLNGTADLIPVAAYIWKGTINANWDTTSANWAGTGSVYVDGLASSNVLFDDTAAVNNINVTPLAVNPNVVTFNNNNAYSFSGSGITVGTAVIKGGSGTTTFQNTLITPSIALNSGGIAIGPTGTLQTPSLTMASGTTFSVAAGGTLSSTTSLASDGTVTFDQAAQILNSLTGTANGVLNLNGTMLSVTSGSTYDGRISGTGSIAKNTPGVLVLTNALSDYSGGSTVDAGTLQLGSASAAGTGAITVSVSGSLALGGAVVVPITINNGGTIGVSANTTTPATITFNGNTTVKTYNPGSNAVSNDLIMSGLLEGSGNITLLSLNGNNPDSQAFRLRGGISTFSGTLTQTQSSKFEIQSAGPVGSPFGTGTLIMTAGTMTNQNGSYSLVNLRNNAGGDWLLGNNVQVTGTGSVLFNMLGSAPAGSRTTMGDLLIGDGQTAVAGSTAGNSMNLVFPTVHLTGGNATFAPQPVGNANFVIAHHMTLGTISENTPGAGITMNGAASLTLTGVNTYTGPTTLSSGTTFLGTGASIATSNNVSIAAGAIFDATANGGFTVPASQTVIDNGTLSGAVSLSGTLRGSGLVQGTLTAASGAVVAPGGGAGILTTQNLDLQTASTFEVELSKLVPMSAPVAGSDYDALSVTNAFPGVLPTVKLGGNLSVLAGMGIEVGDIFSIILNNDVDNVDGTFAGLPNGTVFVAGGQPFQISYGDDSLTAAFELTGGNDVSLLAVPEPGTAALLLGGLAWFGAWRRRRG
jgi:fibronectin-binding autotransporter adhesin